MIEKCYVIPVQKKCNSNCTFCISKTRNYNKEKEYLEINEEFINNLEILKKRGIKTFEITGGGEPLLHNGISVIVNLIKRIIPDSYIKLYTNGNVLKSIGPVDEINISVAHYNTEKNNKIMNPSLPLSLTNKLKFFRQENKDAKIRLSIPLIKGGIDSKSELDEMIKNTDAYTDGYVVRTLYPNCPNYDENYIDFDYEKENVTMEKDNSVADFKGIILWSNGEFYTNWDLIEQRHLYSYMLLKPDARTYINEIEDLINLKNLIVKKRILVENFIENATNFYLDKTEDYLSLIKRHLMNSVYLFGNTGLIYLLDGNMSQKELVTKTYETKKEIRNALGFTGSYNGFISYENELYHLNLVHAPDPEIDFYNRDINMIKELTSTREIKEEEFKLVKKYRSFNIWYYLA